MVPRSYYVTSGGSTSYITLTACTVEETRRTHLNTNREPPSLGVTPYDAVKIREPIPVKSGSAKGHLIEGESTGYPAEGVHHAVDVVKESGTESEKAVSSEYTTPSYYGAFEHGLLTRFTPPEVETSLVSDISDVETPEPYSVMVKAELGKPMDR